MNKHGSPTMLQNIVVGPKAVKKFKTVLAFELVYNVVLDLRLYSPMECWIAIQDSIC